MGNGMRGGREEGKFVSGMGCDVMTGSWSWSDCDKPESDCDIA